MRLFDGVRVLDLSRMLAGPYGSQLLADLGAEVIKIEEPDGGDPVRGMGPPFLPGGESAYFLAINRSKKSVALNLTKEAGREGFDDLVRRSDVGLENFRPGVMERLGGSWPRARPARLGARLRRALRRVRDARRPRGRRGVHREVLGRLLQGARAPGVGARPALPDEPRPRREPRGADAARRGGARDAHDGGLAPAPLTPSPTPPTAPNPRSPTPPTSSPAAPT